MLLSSYADAPGVLTPRCALFEARAFYERLEYQELFCDRAASMYDIDGIFVRSVRVSRLTLRKALKIVPVRAAPRTDPGSWLGDIRDGIGEAFGRNWPFNSQNFLAK